MLNWIGKKVIITGGAGFVGANLTRKLAGLGALVTVLTRPSTDLWRLKSILENINILHGDLLDKGFIDRSYQEVQPEITFNFAFPAGYPVKQKDREQMSAMGLLGTQHLLNTARQTGASKFIQIGSSTEYGPNPSPHKEDDKLSPVSIRGVAKAAATLLCTQFASEFNFPATILRVYAVYGPWEQPDSLVHSTCRSVLNRAILPLTPPGIVRDWIYVDDVIDA